MPGPAAAPGCRPRIRGRRRPSERRARCRRGRRSGDHRDQLSPNAPDREPAQRAQRARQLPGGASTPPMCSSHRNVTTMNGSSSPSSHFDGSALARRTVASARHPGTEHAGTLVSASSSGAESLRPPTPQRIRHRLSPVHRWPDLSRFPRPRSRRSQLRASTAQEGASRDAGAEPRRASSRITRSRAPRPIRP